MAATLSPPDPLIENRLAALANLLRESELHRRSTRSWCNSIALGVLFLILQPLIDGSTTWMLPVLATAMAAAAFWNWRLSRQLPLNLAAAARHLEARFPELRLVLQTALELQPEEHGFSFLQQRVIQHVLRHAAENNWSAPPPSLARWKRWHVVAMMGAFAVLVALSVSVRSRVAGDAARNVARSTAELTVLPGSVEIERGTPVLVTARFGNHLPRDVRLRWQPVEREKHDETMAKSLSDPVFAFNLPPLQSDLTYQVTYDGQASATFRLTVYDLPALVKADVSLVYPAYTGLAPKTIVDTRRVSAVEGTGIIFTFSVNKPLRRATLRDANGSEIPLNPANAERTVFTWSSTLNLSRKLTLQLEDRDGRHNRTPTEIRLDAVPNKAPELRVLSPSGDPRVSTLEEMHLIAEAKDDFALQDYGLAFSIGKGEPEYVSLRKNDSSAVEVRFEHLLPLEPRHLEPGQVVTFFAWADDFDGLGQLRRTTSDLHFAEIRPFDEAYREDESGGSSASQQTGAGNEVVDLVEVQREISIALWKLRHGPTDAEKRKEQLTTLSESETSVRDRLTKLASQLDQPRQVQAARKAGEYIERVLKSLSEASQSETLNALVSAWTNSQGAYEELLKMAPRETRVSQSRNNRSRGGANRSNQRQLNQLDFKNRENRYETESEAQPVASPEQREQLQALSKLRELARRQQEVNQRLKELQTALTAADEEKREEARRELKRLEEEQRKLLADTDELRDRMDRLSPGELTRQAREQLDRTRESMRQSGEKLSEGEVSSALASGARAEQDLENLRDNFRKSSSSQFSEQLREARREARQLAEKQAETEKKLDELAKGSGRSLDDSAAREELARSMQDEKAGREKLLESLRRVAEDSETSEPGLHRRVYDLLRQQGQSGAGSNLETGAEMLRSGFVKEAQEAQKSVGQELQQLRRGVERAAESVLGEETAELRYAQQELENLSKQLQQEQPSGTEERPGKDGKSSRKGERPGEADTSEPGTSSSASGRGRPTDGDPLRSGSPGETREPETSFGGREGGVARNGIAGGGDDGEAFHRLIEEMSNAAAPSSDRPLTGDNFGDWFERLRTVEELTDVPEAKERLAAARERAEALRREFKRHSRQPQWETIESRIAVPLAEARTLLRQELALRENPDALQPVDRDPVPDKYTESVRHYYEALGR